MGRQPLSVTMLSIDFELLVTKDWLLLMRTCGFVRRLDGWSFLRVSVLYLVSKSKSSMFESGGLLLQWPRMVQQTRRIRRKDCMALPPGEFHMYEVLQDTVGHYLKKPKGVSWWMLFFIKLILIAFLSSKEGFLSGWVWPMDSLVSPLDIIPGLDSEYW